MSALQSFVEVWPASSVTTARRVVIPPFLTTTSFLTKFGAGMSTVWTTAPFWTTSTLTLLMPPATPGATREPETSTVIGLPTFAGFGVTVRPQVGTHGFTSTVAVALCPPETAFTVYVPGACARGKHQRNEPPLRSPVTASLSLTDTTTLPSDGGFCTLTLNSTGCVTHALLAPDRLTTGGSTGFGLQASLVSLPMSSIQKLLQALGVMSL